MLKKAIGCCVALTISSWAQGNWQSGVSFLNIADDVQGYSTSVNVISGQLGYVYQVSNTLSITPELRFGNGIKEDDFGFQGTVGIGTFYGVSLRSDYQLQDRVYGFVIASIASLEIEISNGEFYQNSDDWDFGAGLGIGVDLDEALALELSDEYFNGTNIFRVGVKYRF